MENQFRLKGKFLVKDGKAKDISVEYSNKKLCFVATDKNLLMGLLLKLAAMEDCFFVKLTAEPKDGMYLVRCFFTCDKVAGEHWAKYKNHPKLMCNIQDDDFTTNYRNKVQSYD